MFYNSTYCLHRFENDEVVTILDMFFFSHELSQSLGKLKESKKVYKRKINEVESGAASNEHEQSINEVYVLYKATKYKIKLIKALIEKQNK